MINFDIPLLKKEELYDVIPQRPPIVMVDAFYGIEDGVSYTGFTVEESCIFSSDGVLDESGIIEHMAQSAAARVGYLYKNRNEASPIGFIGSVDDVMIEDLPKVGETLRTQLRIEQEVLNITLISAEVETGGRKIASGKMKIFLKKE